MHRSTIGFRLTLVAAGAALFVAGCGTPVVANDVTSDLASDQVVSPDTVDATDTSTDSAADVAAEVSADVPADVPSACPFTTVRALTLPMDSAMGTLSGMSRNPSTTCTTMSGTAGPDDFYTLHVTTRTGVILNAESTIDTMLAIRRACDQPLTEVACNDDRDAMTRNPFIRTILEPGDYVVMVDQIGFGVGGAYTLTLQSFVPAANATCSMATLVMPGTRLSGQDTGTASTRNAACLPAATGLVLYYAVTIPARNQLLAFATPTGMFDPAIRLLTGCTATTCLASVNAAGPGMVETLSYINTTDSPVSVVVGVGGANETLGVFDLDIALRAPPANVACAMATAVMDGTALMAQESTLARDSLTACLPANTGTVRYYSVTVPAGRILRVTATRTAGAGSAVVRVMSSCTATTCLASGEGPGAAVVRFANTTAAPQNVIIAVGGSAATSVTYDLAVSILSAAANASCSTPTVVMGGTMLAGQDTGLGADVSAPCLTGSNGPGLFYSVTIPANNRLVVVATRTGASRAWNPVVRLLSNCAATSCLGQAFGDPLGVAALVFNNGPAAQTLVFSVGSDTAAATGTFDLAVTLQIPAVNAICTTATAVMDGTVIRGENPADARDTIAGCVSPPFSALYYRATIPAGNRLTVTVTSAMPSMGGINVQIVGSCGSTACLGTPSRPGPMTAVTSYVNAGATPQTVIIEAGPLMFGPPSGTFDVSVAIRPPAANSACSAALALTSGTPATAQDIGDASTVVTSCLPMAMGPSLFYSITIPVGRTLSVVARITAPTSPWTPAVRLLSACGAASCLASGSSGGLSYANTTASPQSVIIAVGSDVPGAGGLFDVTAVTATAPFTETMIPTACDDMTAGMVMPLTGDDAVSPVVPLPYSFQFFGETESHFSATTNGFIQLWPSAVGMPSPSYMDAPLPNPMAPTRMIAALWDDLFIDMTADVRTRVIGTSPTRHFTVQWTNVQFFPVGGLPRMTFQIQLYETSNVIEMHYCSLAPAADPRVTGASATVGVQDALGARAYQHSASTPMSISTANAIRLTPGM